MKRIIAVIALLSLCSCGTQTPEPTVSTPQTTTEADTTTATIEETTSSTTIITTEDNTAVSLDKTPQEQAYDDYLAQCEYFKEYDYDEPLKVYEDENISVTTDWWVVADYIFSTRLIIENKTENDIIIKSDNSSINDYDIDLNIYEHIAAGKKKVVFAENDPKDLKNCMAGKDISSIELRIVGSDENSYSHLFESDVITIPIEQ